MERRNFKQPVNIETREDGSNSLNGYAAVFYREDDPGTEFELWEGYVERIMPGAFDRAIREDDVRGLLNHDANMLLGRNKAGTLSLSVDSVGLRYEIDLPDTQVGRDTKISIERGDIDGSSFAFIADSVNRRSVDGVEIREVTSAQLFDVGPVVYPAYAASTADTREAKVDYDDRLKQQQAERDAIACRVKLLTLED
jgi:hypothetical protein|tara:strand:+ start:726 stop:1316 length:591 start_codon:yes stop_codon:yes gene_type:complete